MSFGARAEIRLGALRHNLERLKRPMPGARVLAAVKANAYGHGLVTVSRALDADVDALGVARIPEARRLREAGIRSPIVLLGGVLARDELASAIDLRCDLVVHSEYQVAMLESADGVRLDRVWLKVDTGMRRLGVEPGDAPGFIDRLHRTKAARSLVLMTHFANADDLADDTSLRQIERFRGLTAGFEGDIAIANSAAICGWSERVGASADWQHSGETWIRPGISLYGISPLKGHSAEALGLEPVMHFVTELIAVKPIRAGDRVGYGGTWRAGRDTRLGIIAAGYGDGFSRALPSGTPVLVNGRRVPLAGRVSMDLAAVDLGPDSGDAVGDPVVLWGEALPVEEIAACAKTVAYTLVCGVIDREGRVA